MSNSSQSGVTDQPPPKISQPALLGVTWALCGLAICLVVVRLVIRIKFFQRLFGDDYFAVLAAAILIGNSLMTHLMSGPMYEILNVSNGRLQPDAGFMERASFYLKCQFASTILFWSCLWAVKACFLAFFRRLTSQLKWPRRAWWAIVSTTALAYCGSVMTYPLACTSFVLGECQTSGNIERSLMSLRFSTAVDIITDLLIICLPVYLTVNLKLSLRQKLGLIAVLCLGVVVAIFSVIRIIFTNTTGRQPEISWLALWSSIESSVAVIVACMVSFKVLLTKRRSTRGTPYAGLSGGNGALDREFYGNRSSRQTMPKYGDTTVSVQAAPEEETEMCRISKRQAAGDITVTRSVTIASGGMLPTSTGGRRKVVDDDTESQEQILQR